METKEIKITVRREPTTEGRFKISCEYDAEVLKDLVFAAIADEFIQKAAEFAVAYKLANCADRDSYVKELLDMSSEYANNTKHI